MSENSSHDAVVPRTKAGLRDLIEIIKPRVLIEFGSWEGASALYFLQISEVNNIGTNLICVDTWLGSKEHWTNKFPNSEWSFDRLRVKNGEPQVLNTFKLALDTHNYTKNVEIIRATTSAATSYLMKSDLRVELVYIDADHGFFAVYDDLKNGDKLIDRSGVLAGDDWGWRTVRLSASFYAFSRGRRVLLSTDNSTFIVLSKINYLYNKFKLRGWRRKTLSLSILIFSGSYLLSLFNLNPSKFISKIRISKD